MLRFRKWLEDAGEVSAGYSNGEDPQFSNKVRSKWSPSVSPKPKEQSCAKEGKCKPLMGFMKQKMKRKMKK